MYSIDGIQKNIFSVRLISSSMKHNMAVDGASTPVEFILQPPSNQVWRLADWFIYIEDAKGFNITNYGANGILTNGMEIKGVFGGVEYDLLGFPIKTNSDIMSVTYDMDLKTFGNDNDVLMAKWNFKECGQFIRLDGTQGDMLKVVINDDMTFLHKQIITAKGYIEV